MRRWSADVRSGDADNLEGRAAAYYWKICSTEYLDLKVSHATVRGYRPTISLITDMPSYVP